MPQSALQIISDTIVEIVQETKSPFGVPGGHIYASLMGIGMSLDTYQQIMSALCQSGRVKKIGECYFPGGKS